MDKPVLTNALRVSLAVVVALSGARPSRADVSPVSNNGVPAMVIPQFLETGAPSFVTPIGSDTSTTSTDPTSTDPTSTGTGDTGTGASGGDASIATNYTQYVGQSIGSGQCVALVQAATPSVGLTATWIQGAAVQGNTSLQPGTVIATFGPNGTYTNSADGSSHAAIYLGQNADGIQIEDQWLNHPASTRTIYWSQTGSAANNGSAFYVVSH